MSPSRPPCACPLLPTVQPEDSLLKGELSTPTSFSQSSSKCFGVPTIRTPSSGHCLDCSSPSSSLGLRKHTVPQEGRETSIHSLKTFPQWSSVLAGLQHHVEGVKVSMGVSRVPSSPFVLNSPVLHRPVDPLVAGGACEGRWLSLPAWNQTIAATF